jgi:cytochrome c oxidase subunit 1
MANATSTGESEYTFPAPAQVGREPGSLTRLVQEMVFTVDHKRLGLMYIGAGLLFFVVAGIMATLIRIQLLFPHSTWLKLIGHSTFLDPDVFNRFFTMHGTAMVFLVGMPIIFGFANYLIPLMIGTRDMAFPRLNAFGFWVFFFSGLFLYASYFTAPGLYNAGSAPDVGWFAYAPLMSKAFSRGHSSDYWTLSILLGGIGSIATAINILVTIFCYRCKGMTLGRMPLFVWMWIVVAFLVIIALPPLSAAQIMITLDRYLGAKFFDTQAGGSAVLWQHFFWIFGHPEVYILIIPGFAIASEVIPVFSRKPIFGYPIMVAATVMIGFISLGVWAHHMFTVGMTSIGNTFFAISTMIIAIPTGIKIFNWLGTMYGGKIRFELPMIFALAFLFQFLCAGLTGIMLSVATFDWQLHDSYFVVAHFHYVLIGALLYMFFAGFYYWFPKAFGRMPNKRLGLWHFWLFTIGFNLTFMPMHILGFLGMPRRIFTYEADRGWEIWNQIATVGLLFQIPGILIFVYNLIYSYVKGKEAGDDPWDAWTLEWATTSPPPEYNFDKNPEVRSRRPLWDLKHPEDPDWKFE